MYTKPMRLEDTQYQLIHGNPPPKDAKADLFGVEIELEGRYLKQPPDAVLRQWTMHNDGSLRERDGGQAVEYVFAHPLGLEDAVGAINNLCAYLNKKPVEVFDSYRTSVHVHINCLSETMRTVYNFITIAIILDELLVSQNGENRIGNNFCLRAKDAEGLIASMVSNIQNYGYIFNGRRGMAEERYSSINVQSLLKFGTIEFRSLECTTDTERLIHWIKTLQNMKEAARKFEDPRDVIQQFSMLGAGDFLAHVLRQQALKYVRVPDFEYMMSSGSRLAQDFAYCSNWTALKKGEKPPPREGGAYQDFADAIAAQEYPGGFAPPPARLQPRGDGIRDQLQQHLDRARAGGRHGEIFDGYGHNYYIDVNQVVRRRIHQNVEQYPERDDPNVVRVRDEAIHNVQWAQIDPFQYAAGRWGAPAPAHADVPEQADAARPNRRARREHLQQPPQPNEDF